MTHSDDLFVQYNTFKELQKRHKKNKIEWNIQERCKIKELKQNIIHNIKITQEIETQSRLIGIVAFVNLDYIKFPFVSDNEKENISLGTIEMLKPYATKDECLYIYLKLVNFTSFLLVKYEKFLESQKILEEADAIYLSEKGENSKCSYILTAEELFENSQPNITSENLSEVYKLVTSNTQILAYIYFKLGKNYKFQLFENMVLQRQLESADVSPEQWAKKATSLAAHFLFNGKFVETRHHLAAAYVVLQYCEEDMRKRGPNHRGKYNNLHVNITELAKMWVKYGITLFDRSRENYPRKTSETELVSPRLEKANSEITQPSVLISEDKTILSNLAEIAKVHKQKDENVYSEKSKNDSDFSNGDAQKNQDEYEKQIKFHSLDLESVESQVTVELIENTEQARQLFQFTYAWLVKLKSYHMISNLITGHMECMMYLKELYKYVAYYEKSVESKYNILKKRADTLDSLIEVLRVNNLPVHVQLTIDLLRELSEVQLELILLNISKLSLENVTESGADAQNDDIKMQKMAAITRIHSKLDMCSKSLSESAVKAHQENK